MAAAARRTRSTTGRPLGAWAMTRLKPSALLPREIAHRQAELTALAPRRLRRRLGAALLLELADHNLGRHHPLVAPEEREPGAAARRRKPHERRQIGGEADRPALV